MALSQKDIQEFRDKWKRLNEKYEKLIRRYAEESGIDLDELREEEEPVVDEPIDG